MINLEKLESYLSKNGMPILSLVYGQETLLNIEALELLKNWGKKNNFLEIKRLDIEKPSDWKNAYDEMQPSFFSPQIFLEIHTKSKSLDKSAIEFINNCLKKADKFLKIVILAPRLEKLDKKKMEGEFLEIKSQPLEAEKFREEIIKRLKKANLILDAEALEKFILFYEGNFLLANQAIKRLTQYGKTNLTTADIEEYLEDLALFSVLQLRDAVLERKWLEAYRITEKIFKADKNALTLINWNLNAIFTALLELQKSPESNWTAIIISLKIFGKSQSLCKKAAKLFKETEIINFLRLIAKIDRETKGGQKGDGWISLMNYFSQLEISNLPKARA